VLLYHTPDSIAKLFPKVLFHLPRVEKKLYLTFDDGPHPDITKWVLEELDKFDAKATFFCVGENLKNFNDFIDAFHKNGHRIGNHTFNHLNGWNTKAEIYYQNIDEFQELYPAAFFRPPYGKIKTRQTAAISEHMKVVLWDVLTGDFNENLSSQSCLKHVLKYTKPGSILVFHDSLKAEKTLKTLLPQVLKHYSKNKFTFEALPSFDNPKKNNV
tara:strand:+ start:12691 stop:13332 length:642 start_codon:yes stop_codon:yes gene_type:complete